MAASGAATALVSVDKLSLEEYAARYTGRARLARLLFVADRCEAEPLELEALRALHDEARRAEDTPLYRDAVRRIDGRLGPRYDLDEPWFDSVERRVQRRLESLEGDLRAHEINMSKESIRRAYTDIGDLYYSHGHLSKAAQSYIMTSDYCNTSKNIFQMCMRLIVVSIDLRQFDDVANYVKKAEQTPDPLDAITVSKLRAAEGLAYMGLGDCGMAAYTFIKTTPKLGNNYAQVLTPQDMVLYGTICALASFDQPHLKVLVIENIQFRPFLDQVPEIKKLVMDFDSCRYESCLKHLDKLEPNLLLDIYLYEHLETLYKDIHHNLLKEMKRMNATRKKASTCFAYLDLAAGVCDDPPIREDHHVYAAHLAGRPNMAIAGLLAHVAGRSDGISENELQCLHDALVNLLDSKLCMVKTFELKSEEEIMIIHLNKLKMDFERTCNEAIAMVSEHILLSASTLEMVRGCHNMTAMLHFYLYSIRSDVTQKNKSFSKYLEATDAVNSLDWPSDDSSKPLNLYSPELELAQGVTSLELSASDSELDLTPDAPADSRASRSYLCGDLPR